MKKNIYKKVYLIALLGTLAILSSCDNAFLDNVEAKGKISSETAFSDEGAIQLLINGLYYDFGYTYGFGPGTGNTLSSLEVFSDETQYKPYAGSTMSEAYNSANYLPSYNSIENLWKGPYQLIYQANLILEGLPNATAVLTDAKRNEFKAQALFFRGLSHFFLANLYGDVPLVLTSEYADNKSTPRTAKADVYAQSLADVIAARDLLPATPPADSRYYTSKYQIEAYLSNIYLTLGQWKNAEDAATDVIDNGGFSLPALGTNFDRGSSEAILSIGPTFSYYPNGADYGIWFMYYSKSISSMLSPSDSLIHAYDSSDPRLDTWLPVVTAKVGTIRTVKKYKYSNMTIGSATEADAQDNIYMRLAEVYLIRAEARAQQNIVSGAVDDINQVRNRAGATPIASSTKEDVLKKVETERVLELCFEGRRWLDLNRWGTTDQVYTKLKGNYKTGWASYKALLPIPTAELAANPNLKQNPSY